MKVLSEKRDERDAAVDLLTRRMTASVNLVRALGGGFEKGKAP